MSGFELARAARAARSGLKVLFTSGYADPELVARERSEEPADWPMLRKPYTTEQLAQVVRGILDAEP